MQVVPARGYRGFTLIELMVALAVLAVMFVAAAPSFADFFERYRLRSAVDDTVSLFATARQGAVEEDRNVNVAVGGDTSNWCVGAVQQAVPGLYQPVGLTPTACNCVTAPNTCVVNGETLVVDGSGRPGVKLAAGGTTFAYDSKNGTLADLTATPSVEFISPSDKYRLRVLVSALGQARACVPAGKRPIPGYPSC
ncbi:MAG: prepilin-type N-terminal cleavage/methylation domain-containing protein [Pseudomonadota bacterium]|nr:prepilin-type N-terminal cleavage/methylation domain-containing protein [Pseudomonadota bacterium]